MNARKFVHSHYHKAPLRGAWVRYRAPRRAQRARGGRDDQVDVGFGQDSEVYLREIKELIMGRGTPEIRLRYAGDPAGRPGHGADSPLGNGPT